MDWTAASVIAGIVAPLVAVAAIIVSLIVYRRQELVERRQLLLPLWEQVKGLPDINPRKPVWSDVSRAANSLELIAVCWEADLVDRRLLRRMFGGVYVEMYEKVVECRNPPKTVAKDGKAMLGDCPAATALYQRLQGEV